jgi:ketosteroid isomerase-like protein
MDVGSVLLPENRAPNRLFEEGASMETLGATINRRELLRRGMAASALSIAGLGVTTFPAQASDDGGNGRVSGPGRAVAKIYELQAAFHQAKTAQDLDLMMSLWAEDATFTNRSTGTTYHGFGSIKSFWQGSGSFTHYRFSLVPSFKTTIHVDGDEAFLYFECHDVGNFATGGFNDPAVKTIVNDTFLAGVLRRVDGSWLFWNMTAGPSSPLSLDHYYFP